MTYRCAPLVAFAGGQERNGEEAMTYYIDKPAPDCDVCEGTGVFGMYVQHDNSGAHAQVHGLNDQVWPDGWLTIELCGTCHRFAANDDAAAFWFERWKAQYDSCDCDECEGVAPEDDPPHGRWEMTVDPTSLRNHALDEVPPEGAKYIRPEPEKKEKS